MGQGQSEGPSKVNYRQRDPSPTSRSDCGAESVVNANFEEIAYVAASSTDDASADTENESDTPTHISSRRIVSRRSSGPLRWPFCFEFSSGSRSSFNESVTVQTPQNASSNYATSVCHSGTFRNGDCAADDVDGSTLIYCVCRRISLPLQTVRELGLAGDEFYCER